MQFKDFYQGQVIHAGPYVLSQEQLLAFARDYDPQWFHIDAEAAAAGPYGELIASGWQSCAIAMRLVVEAALQGSESFGSPGLSTLKWLAPVRAGDALSVQATVLNVRTSEKRPHLGVLLWRWQLFNQHQVEVLHLEATSLFDLGRGG